VFKKYLPGFEGFSGDYASFKKLLEQGVTKLQADNWADNDKYVLIFCFYLEKSNMFYVFVWIPVAWSIGTIAVTVRDPLWIPTLIKLT